MTRSADPSLGPPSPLLWMLPAEISHQIIAGSVPSGSHTRLSPSIARLSLNTSGTPKTLPISPPQHAAPPM